MDALAQSLTPLGDLPVGATAEIVRIRGGRGLRRRLVALGLRSGSDVTVLHLRGRGVVLSSGETRIALGGGVAEKILVAVRTLPGDMRLGMPSNVGASSGSS